MGAPPKNFLTISDIHCTKFSQELIKNEYCALRAIYSFLQELLRDSIKRFFFKSTEGRPFLSEPNLCQNHFRQFISGLTFKCLFILFWYFQEKKTNLIFVVCPSNMLKAKNNNIYIIHSRYPDIRV